MLSKQDSLQLQKDFKKVFVTKKEFRETKNLFLTRFDELFVEMKAIRVGIKAIRNDYLKMNDTVAVTRSDLMGELQAIREEQTVGGYRQALHSDQLEDHENRLVSLEAKPS